MKLNRLAGETSPYLLQHKDNPVHWLPWGEEAFAEARRLDRPVFLSIGYSTCHWCHVMAHESFENPEIAAVLNEFFVSIKVDREERPDVDRLYMAFVQATTDSGGWPMSVWLTPEGKPFFGGTYFPPEDRYGRAGFPSVLRQIAQLWREDRPRIDQEASRVMAALAEAAGAKGSGSSLPGPEALQRGFEHFSQTFDSARGGFGGAPKFPRPSVLNFLLRVAASGTGGDKEERSRVMVLSTLRKMAAGGLRDHLGGGFHRYSVDAEWHVPHFEKMLYDQAQLAISYLEAWQFSGEEVFAQICRETLDYVLRDLTDPQGGFYSAEDADSFLAHGQPEHAEGAFYVWTRAEIESVLSPPAAEEFCRHYGVQPAGNASPGSDPHGEFAGKNILFKAQPGDSPSLQASRAALFARRAERPRPHRDDKILTAWNGLMISAFARAGAALEEPRYLAAAQRAAGFIRTHLLRDGFLRRSWRGQTNAVGGFAEDYAFLIQGLIDLYEADFQDHWLAWAADLQEKQDQRFWDETVGNYFGSAAGDPLVPVRLKDDYDGAEPSVNSISAINLLRLGRMLDQRSFEQRAVSILAASRDILERAPTAVPQMLVALDLALSPPEQAVVAGRRGTDEVRRWNAGLHRAFHPRRVRLLADGGFVTEKNPALAAMKPVGGRAALYLCENFTCQAPRTLP